MGGYVETKKELPYGVEGELCISGKHIFKEYYREPKLTGDTKFIFKNRQYIHTGMMGFLDEDGYFTLTGRTSRFYINGDLNKIYLERVQNIISLIKGVESCIAVPKPNDEKLFACKVFIVPTKDTVVDENYVSFLKTQFTKPLVDVNGDEIQLKPYEIPESLEIIEKLPRCMDKGDKIDVSLLEQKAIKEYEIEKEKKSAFCSE